MSEYTPTTEDPALEEVRAWYIDGRRVHNPFASDAVLVARFDTWLTEHDREVAAKALTDAAVATVPHTMIGQNNERVVTPRFVHGRTTRELLLARAAAIVSVPSTPEQPEGGDS
jgi:hypothetical protein